MRDAALVWTRTLAAAAMVVAVLAGGCDLSDLTGPDGLLNVSLPGGTPEIGQDVMFDGQVVSVDTEGGTLELADGTHVSITEATAFNEEFDVPTLEAAREALEGERDLIAWGSGRVEGVEPLVIDGAELTLKRAERIEFEGQVTGVDPTAGTFTLEEGTVVRVTRATELGDDFDVASLGAALEALEAGKELLVWGHGWERSAEPRALLASAATFKVTWPPTVEFEGGVASVKPDSGIVHLEDGTVVRVNEETRVKNEYGIPSLDAARERLDAGESLVAWGHGGLGGEEPRTIEAYSLVFNVPGYQPTEFEGEIVAIYVEAGTVELASGTVVQVTDETGIDAEHGIESLATAKEHLDAGADLIGWGRGEVESEEPLTIRAFTLTFKVRVSEFEGHIASVDLEHDTFELANGTIVMVNAETEFSAEYGIPSLEAAKLAIDEGKTVAAWGHGRLESEEPRTILASGATFKEVE